MFLRPSGGWNLKHISIKWVYVWSVEGKICCTFFHREYLGRQLQSTDQQQAPAVAARSWTVPVHVCLCITVWMSVYCVYMDLFHFNDQLLISRNNLKKSDSVVFFHLHPNDPWCYMIWLSCFVLCPQLSDVWWLKSQFVCDSVKNCKLFKSYL